jgi:oxygen-independent coproporphyrinogen-3 oxidase
MNQILTQPPQSLYVHIPWCIRKCPYCDFNSHELQDTLPENAYVDALLLDLDLALNGVLETSPLVSIFIGGGTPSLFRPESLEKLLDGIRARIDCEKDMEVTLEANPGTLEQGKFTEFRAAGINRLSIGVQSFDDASLQALGRIHDRRQAIRAIEAAHDAGFEVFNLDLMFGLPGQNLPGALADLQHAIDLEPGHISWYQLTLEPNTHFYQFPPRVPDEGILWDMTVRGQEKLAEYGFMQYEVSAYTREKRCRHNLNYWLFGDYIGIGAGAHGKRTDPSSHKVTRERRCRHPREYLNKTLQGPGCVQAESIGEQDLPLEFMMNALRLNQGFDLALFEARTGLPADILGPGLHKATETDLVEVDGDHVQPTATGRRYLNNLVEYFLE